MIRNHSNARYSLILALVLACSISAGRLRAQTFITNTEYNFRVQQATDEQSYGNPSIADPVPVLSMSCLAANGYGQWTLSTTPGKGTNLNTGSLGSDEFPSGWYLLGNGLYQPSTGYISTDVTHHPQCIPPGVVQCGTFPTSNPIPSPAQVKAVANLDGMVAFIWANSGGTAFVQSGFTSADVDISLSFLSNPTPWTSLSSPGNMKVVSSSIHTAPAGPPTLTDWLPIPVGPNMITALAGDWHDVFDVSADASFIYIVWGSIPATPPGSNEQIWVTVVPIGSATPVAGFPMMIPGSGDKCVNPTITCDPRNNRGGGTYPAFDVAYIDQTTNKIMVSSYSSGVLSIPAPLSLTFWDPSVGPPGQVDSYSIPMHARILRSSIVGGTSTLAVYATVSSGTTTTGGLSNTWLIFYAPTNIFGTANFVAGTKPLVIAPSPIPAETGITNIDPPVIDHAIVAFADPYDNQAGWHSIDEFHCLYQYDLSYTFIPSIHDYPLCIVRGSDVKAAYPPQPDGLTDDTRLVLNQTGGIHSMLESYPALDVNSCYVAAINQMGIHVHWRTQEGVHFYARDMNRTFDEAIDKNTLVTDQCYVTDGSSTGSNHGGTVGATIVTPSAFEVPVSRMTVWTDPNYGPPSLDGTNGLYSPPSLLILPTLSPYVGTLTFTGSNVVLKVGDDILHSDYDFGYYTGATLAVMPYFYFNFPGSGQGVTVNFASTFDYWGLNATHDALGNQTGIATPFTDGSADGYGSGTIDLEGGYTEYGRQYATLNVHGGADFYMGGGVTGALSGGEVGTLISNIGTIDVLYEPSVYPTRSGTTIGSATGHMTLLGFSTLTNGQLQGNIPYSTTDPAFSRRVIMTVDFGHASSFAPQQFLATNVNIQNSDPSGTSELLFGHPLRIGNYDAETFGIVKFDGCSCSAIEIHAIDPSAGSSELKISDGCDFENIRNKCIFVENDLDPITAWYGAVIIDGNTFGSFAPDVDYFSVSDEMVDTLIGTTHSLTNIPAPYGIYFKNFDDNATGPWNEDYLQYTVPVISNNQFTYSGNWNVDLNAQSATDRAQFGTGSSAIGLENSTAMVLNNTISDDGYDVGIGMRWNGLTPPKTYSVICGNIISGLEHENTTNDPPNADEIGISANFGGGVISLNKITHCDIGIDCFSNDNSFQLYNSVTAYRETALDVNHNSTGQLSGNPRLSGAYNSFSGETFDPVEGEAISVITLEGFGMDLEQGKNNIYYTSTDPAFPLHPLLIATYAVTDNIDVIDGNWWGNNIDPYSQSSSCSTGCTCVQCYWKSGENDAGGVSGDLSYTATSGGVRLDSSSIPTDAVCPASAGCLGCTSIIESRKDTNFSVSDDTENCDSLRFKIYNYSGSGKWQQLYDTTKKFIETCYNNYWAPAMFQEFSTALQPLAGTDTTLWVQGRLWLESVLYLNTTNPEYFCACVEAIAGTFHSPSDTSETLYWKEENRGMSIGRWLIQNTTCDTPFLQNQFYATRASQYQSWLNDTMVPLDTTLPPLDSIQQGLKELLEKHFLYATVSGTPPPSIISNATANPNPAHDGTVISFGISKQAYVKIELFDLLGHEVSGVNFESLFEPGNKSVPISLAGLATGTYYARILTAYGEVQTVKLVKQ